MEVPSMSPLRAKRTRSPPSSPDGKRSRVRLHSASSHPPPQSTTDVTERTGPIRSGEDALVAMLGSSQLYTPPAPIVQQLCFDRINAKLSTSHATVETGGGMATEPTRALPDDIVRIDVGGTVFKTRRATLTSVRGSLLESIFSQDGVHSTFIDRDPRYFDTILGWLRDRTVPVVWPVQDPAFIRDVHHYQLTQEILGDGQLLIVGGEDDDGPFDTATAFSPVSSRWSYLKSAPLRIDAHGCATLNGVAYVCGGYEHRGKKLRATFRFLQESGRWERMGDLNVARARHQMAAANGKLYAIGGLLSKAGSDEHGEAFIEEYCPDSNTWTVLPVTLEARYGFSAVSVGSSIYFMGGLTLEGVRLDTLERFDALTGTIERLANLPSARAFLSCAIVGHTLYAMGGNDVTNTPCDNVDVFDTVTGAWTQGPCLLTRRCDAAAGVLNGIVYLCGGEDEEDFVSAVHMLDTTTGQWTEGPPLGEAKSSLVACVVPY
eukprot:m.192630 g.192630  ORF g.192630 m.192630 type:complete len:490 (+) comp18708_c0_seq1:183-1652(+)